MPPGKGLAELAFGRSPLSKLWGSSKPAVRQQISHVHTSKPAQAIHAPAAAAQQAVKHSVGGRFVNALVEVFSPLVRAPGAKPTARPIEAVHKVVGRTVNARAGYHTLAGSTRQSAFGNLRPQGIPRSPGNVGLQSARNFSSSRTVFENVVHNAPLGLRVLGDKDRLDMARFRRAMKAAHLKHRKAEQAQGKGKGRMVQVPRASAGVIPSTFESYFPVKVESAAEKPSVQLVLSLNPVNESTSFLTFSEDAEESRFFSAMLMSDLRFLSELHGAHHARLRNVIEKLERAGCFELDSATGHVLVKADLDEARRVIVVTFRGGRWGMADVKQVLGLYDGHDCPWYQIVDLQEDTAELSGSELTSCLPSDIDSLSSSFSYAESASSFDTDQEHERINISMRLPTLATPSVAEHRGSYLWGVSDFLDGLESQPRPRF